MSNRKDGGAGQLRTSFEIDEPLIGVRAALLRWKEVVARSRTVCDERVLSNGGPYNEGSCTSRAAAGQQLQRGDRSSRAVADCERVHTREREELHRGGARCPDGRQAYRRASLAGHSCEKGGRQRAITRARPVRAVTNCWASASRAKPASAADRSSADERQRMLAPARVKALRRRGAKQEGLVLHPRAAKRWSTVRAGRRRQRV